MIDPETQYELIKRHMQDLQADAARRTLMREAPRTSDRTGVSVLRTITVSWSSLRRAVPWGRRERLEDAVPRLSLVSCDDAEACSACACAATGTHE